MRARLRAAAGVLALTAQRSRANRRLEHAETARLTAGVCGFPDGTTAIRYSFKLAANLRTESKLITAARFRPSVETGKTSALIPSSLTRFSNGRSNQPRLPRLT